MITWDKNFFKTILSDQKLNKKNEYLANVFAAGLLLPEEGLRQQIRHLNEDDSIQYSTIMAIAREYGVSIQTLLYRLEFLGLVNQEFVDNSLADPLFQSSIAEKGRKSYSNQTQIGDRFIRIAYLAYQFGKISRSRFARLVDTSLVSLESFLASHGLMEIDNEKTRLGNS
jgi:Zn-dependent peptidase ImmA (M78 family)